MKDGIRRRIEEVESAEKLSFRKESDQIGPGRAP